MSWTRRGPDIHNHEGQRIASARYGRVRPCSMKVGDEEQEEALALMVKAPEMWAALHAALPLLIKLGDFIGNADHRCEIILQVRAALEGKDA